MLYIPHMISRAPDRVMINSNIVTPENHVVVSQKNSLLLAVPLGLLGLMVKSRAS